MLTLSYGYQKPQLDDTGDIFYPAMEANIQQMNDHKHDGVTGAILAPTTQVISSASWAAVAGKVDTYSQVVTLPTGFFYDTLVLTFRLSTGEPVYPSVSRTSATSYTVFVNDNTLNLVAEYSS